MFVDYFMQMLAATAAQMVHPLIPILVYFFQRFGLYLTNKCCLPMRHLRWDCQYRKEL